MAKSEKAKKHFVLQVEGKDSNVVFTNAQPRGAALKAASRGYTNIQLRERGTKRVHIFEGKRVQVEAPSNRPTWLPNAVWKPVVSKKGITHLK